MHDERKRGKEPVRARVSVGVRLRLNNLMSAWETWVVYRLYSLTLFILFLYRGYDVLMSWWGNKKKMQSLPEVVN